MQTNQSGFTLIELLIVMSIISILTSMALPSMHDRIVRVQVQEALNIAQMGKEAVAHFHKKKARFPTNNQTAGLPPSDQIMGNYLQSLEIRKGALYLTLGKKINTRVQGKILVIRPVFVAGSPSVPISWVCGFSSVPKGMNVIGNNESTIEAHYLPIQCRY